MSIKKIDTPKFCETKCQWRCNWDFLMSPAWCSLTRKEQQVFYYIYTCIIWVKKKKRDIRYIASNNGDIEISSIIIREKIKMSSKTYTKAIKKLISVGLIRLTREGQNKTCHMFKVLFGDACNSNEIRWNKYPEQNWEHEVPKSPNNLIGKDSRWKAGECGNPNYKSHPTKVNGIDENQSKEVPVYNGIKVSKYEERDY